HLSGWNRGGGEELGAARGRHSASQAASLPLPPLPWIKLCESHPLGNPLLPLAHDPSPKPGRLFLGGGGRGDVENSLQFSTKSMNSRHLILHPSLGLGPLHVSQVQNHCPRRRAGEAGLRTFGDREVWREEEK
uniref:Uncharacterized protein n=1 Tax=Cebus imitator TaxID=2715852 RepID=A0A2K5RCW4_CEBIM